jgi:hypothetical protein
MDVPYYRFESEANNGRESGMNLRSEFNLQVADYYRRKLKLEL